MNKKYGENPISSDDISSYIENNTSQKADAVRKIQEVKESIAGKVMKTVVGGKKSQLFSGLELKQAEEAYLKALSEIQQIDTVFNENYLNSLKSVFELLGKNNSDSLNIGNNFDYKKFERLSYLIEKFGDLNSHRLKLLLNSKSLGLKDKQLINEYLSLTRQEAVEQTKNKKIYFDQEIFDELYSQNSKPKNIPCFFEVDNNGNKHYFSLNNLTNDLLTFGNEVGLPNIEQIPEKYIKYFPSINRRIKYSLALNIIGNLRDKQEILIYTLADFDKMPNKGYENSGKLAELLVEWYFRSLASNYGEYSISVAKGSCLQDQKGKIDLIVSIKNEKTGVNIKKLLQLTLQNDENILAKKRRQIGKTSTQLLQVKLDDLKKKVSLWRKFNRPIGGIEELITIEEKDFLINAFENIIGEFINQ